MPERIYLDTCVLNRLTDDLSQPRIRSEAVAVEQVLSLVAAGIVHWTGSQVVRLEILRNPDQDRREQTLPLLHFAQRELVPVPATYQAAEDLRRVGFDYLDALHLAVCEAAGLDCLLTVDDRLIRRTARLRSGIRPEVINPVDWLARRAI
jgi:predicted nucleic acid-binding protein